MTTGRMGCRVFDSAIGFDLRWRGGTERYPKSSARVRRTCGKARKSLPLEGLQPSSGPPGEVGRAHPAAGFPAECRFSDTRGERASAGYFSPCLSSRE